MDNIIKLLGIEDADIEIVDICIEGQKKFITLETKHYPHFCPQCGTRMYSKGVKTRTIRHSILQDGYALVLLLKQRRWKCTSKVCGYDEAEKFKFVSKFKQTTNATELLVVEAFRDFSITAAQVAERFNISDHHALNIFDKYVKMDRLQLTNAISVDEVYLDMDPYCKYVLVIQDFITGDPIDLVVSRQSKVTEPYFSKIPRAERERVKYLISDMYNPYISYVDNYFPNAISVVDSFHVMQWIIRKLDLFIRALLKEFKERDRRKEEELSASKGHPVSLPLSHEVYLLQNYRWLLLKNQAEINYDLPRKKDFHFGCMMDIYAYEERFFGIHEDLYPLRGLKEQYVSFNRRNAGQPDAAAQELDELIELYYNCGYEIFQEFSRLLIKYRQPIINSFILHEKIGSDGVYTARLSNGPIESLNRKAKDMKRNARGFTNFEHLRNRFLFATRGRAAIHWRKN